MVFKLRMNVCNRACKLNYLKRRIQICYVLSSTALSFKNNCRRNIKTKNINSAFVWIMRRVIDIDVWSLLHCLQSDSRNNASSNFFVPKFELWSLNTSFRHTETLTTLKFIGMKNLLYFLAHFRRNNSFIYLLASSKRHLRIRFCATFTHAPANVNTCKCTRARWYIIRIKRKSWEWWHHLSRRAVNVASAMTFLTPLYIMYTFTHLICI